MSDEENEAYAAEADYFEEDEDIEEELEEEEEEEDKDIEVEEDDWQPVVQKINEQDRNHRIRKIVPPDQRQSSHILRFSEMVELIGIRISQIEQGSPVFTDYIGLDNAIDIAKKELLDRQNPLTLLRTMRSSETEIEIEKFDVNTMTFPISEREILSLTVEQIKQYK